ncbi:MAG TPA: EVE domain-containing protein [Xanthomonadales bacterium]|nr:EVE domain-containing protein [Xanthomonadales bacterium]
MKSEPDDFSIDDLARRKREPWSGVRNYQARNYMRDEMQVGDGVLFYHSSCAVPGVYGLARVASEPYPDPTQFDRRSDYHDPESRREEPRWHLVDVAYERTFARPVTLDMLKAEPKLDGLLALKRGNRLSITPVSTAHYRRIVAMGGAKP